MCAESWSLTKCHHSRLFSSTLRQHFCGEVCLMLSEVSLVHDLIVILVSGWDEAILEWECVRDPTTRLQSDPGATIGRSAQVRTDVRPRQQLLPASQSGQRHQCPHLWPRLGLRTVWTRLPGLAFKPRGLLHEHLPKHQSPTYLCKCSQIAHKMFIFINLFQGSNLDGSPRHSLGSNNSSNLSTPPSPARDVGSSSYES